MRHPSIGLCIQRVWFLGPPILDNKSSCTTVHVAVLFNITRCIYKLKASCERETKWSKVSKIRLSYSNGLFLLLSHQVFNYHVIFKWMPRCALKIFLVHIGMNCMYCSRMGKCEIVRWPYCIIHCKGEITCHSWPCKMSSDKKHYSHGLLLYTHMYHSHIYSMYISHYYHNKNLFINHDRPW